jgi:penicillin-binding protein 2
MLNRLLSPMRDAGEATSDRWAIDRSPRLRLAGLFGVFVLPMCVIGVRLAHVQLYLGDDFVAEFERTVERREPIPTRDGRILSSDGQVLAEDVELFGLMVHYRWLEEPVDRTWLRQQAHSKLDRAARRNPARVATEEAAVLKRREELWQRLTTVTGQSRDMLVRQRRAIQRRVERIYGLVEQRREERHEASVELFRNGRVVENSRWGAIWNTIVAALTTSPQREAVEPLVIREQRDYHPLLAEIPVETAVEIEAHPEGYPGTRIETRTERTYPQGEAAAHLIGYRTPVDDEALLARRQDLPDGDPLDYRPGDRQGRTGLERFYERHLRGLRGERKAVFNRRGELIESAVLREPQYGRDLVLSLNLPLQRAAEQLLDDQLSRQHVDEANGAALPVPPGGAIVAIDVRTGAVLAAASAPRFDLRAVADRDEALWNKAAADPRNPFFHRACEMALPPGSVFKIVSAAAFLESGRIDPEKEFHCQGYLDEPDRYRCFTFRNFGVGHGDVNLVGALARSCNVYFFSGARRVGFEPLHDWAARFGFGQPTGIDLPTENPGTLPSPLPPLARGGQGGSRSRTTADTLQLAIGQARLTSTPMQIARLMAAVANGGRLVTPYLADSSGPTPSLAGDNNHRDLSTAAARPVPELNARTLEWLRLGLRQVVAHPQGTGYKTVRLKDVAIAGKTGTAETGANRPDHAWFAGYVPADNPTIAFVVVLEHAGPGGHAAGPVAREFVQALQALGLLAGAQIAGPSAN